MRKFELQLQLASIEWQVPSTNPTALDSSAKSLGDLKAPKQTLFPEPCPHIFAPGEPKLFTDLSLAEFCAGYAVIIQNCKIPSQKEQLLQHFQDLMTLASSYKWSAVRSFHSKVLRSIELGLTITSNDQTITSNSLSSSQLPSLTTQILSHPEPTESPRRSAPISRHQNFIALHTKLQRATGPNASTLRLPVSSKLNIPEWRSRLRHYPDRDLCDFREFGWPTGHASTLNIPASSQTNHRSARANPQIIAAIFFQSSYLTAGYYSPSNRIQPLRKTTCGR